MTAGTTATTQRRRTEVFLHDDYFSPGWRDQLDHGWGTFPPSSLRLRLRNLLDSFLSH